MWRHLNDIRARHSADDPLLVTKVIVPGLTSLTYSRRSTT
jgi:hypothetical protein